MRNTKLFIVLCKESPSNLINVLGPFSIILLSSQGGPLLVTGGQPFFGFVKRCLVYLWVRYMVHNQYIFGVTNEKI